MRCLTACRTILCDPVLCCRLAFGEVRERSRQLVAILLEGPPRARNMDELLLKESMDVIGARARCLARSQPRRVPLRWPGPSPARLQAEQRVDMLLTYRRLPRVLVHPVTAGCKREEARDRGRVRER